VRLAPVIALAVAGAILFLSRRAESFEGRGDFESETEQLDSFDYQPPMIIDDFSWEYPTVNDDPVFDPRDVNARRFSPSFMMPSEALKDWLREKEDFRGDKYKLGDGGVTIGFGWYEPYSRAHLMPDRISLADALAKFEEHVESRGAAWVRQYVTVPMTQNEFDAFTSLAYNLSPRSFRRIANALNAGEDWRAVALQFVRPGSRLERGLRNRRASEIAMFDQGVYA